MTSTLFLLSLILSSVIAKDCFNPNGSREITHLPCVGNAVNTHCCPPGSTCLTNGLCLMEDDAALTTGSCTERNWDELACFHTCFGALGDDLTAPSTVYRCDGDFWCCSAGSNNATSCCATTSDKFALKQGSRALIQNGTSFNKGYTLVSIAEPASTSAPPPASAQPAAATGAEPSKTASGQVSTGPAAVASADADSERMKVGLGAGLGVGLPLLLALLAALFLLAWEKRVNRRLRADSHARNPHATELDSRGALNLPAMKQTYPPSYPELSAHKPTVSELANHHVGVPT